MQKSLFRLAGVVVVSVALSACAQQGGYGYNTGLAPDVQRAAGGALAGAVVAAAAARLAHRATFRSVGWP